MPHTLGQLARETGLSVETVRFYERKSLLGDTNRAASGYRQYGKDALTRLRFIRQAKKLGFTLREIGELLDLRVHPGEPCEQVHEAASTKLQMIETKIKELRQIRKALKRLTAVCSGKRTIEECSILGELEAGLNRPPSRERE